MGEQGARITGQDDVVPSLARWTVEGLPGLVESVSLCYAASASKRHGILYLRAEYRLTGL